MPTEVASGVHRLGNSYVNCYLIEDGNQLTLVDAGVMLVGHEAIDCKASEANALGEPWADGPGSAVAHAREVGVT